MSFPWLPTPCVELRAGAALSSELFPGHLCVFRAFALSRERMRGCVPLSRLRFLSVGLFALSRNKGVGALAFSLPAHSSGSFADLLVTHHVACNRASEALAFFLVSGSLLRCSCRPLGFVPCGLLGSREVYSIFLLVRGGLCLTHVMGRPSAPSSPSWHRYALPW